MGTCPAGMSPFSWARHASEAQLRSHHGIIALDVAEPGFALREQPEAAEILGDAEPGAAVAAGAVLLDANAVAGDFELGAVAVAALDRQRQQQRGLERQAGPAVLGLKP